MKKYSIIAILMLCFSFAVLSVPAPGRGSILLLEPFARGISLGNAGTALQGTGEGLFYNPAAICGVLRSEVRTAIDLRSDGLITPAITFAVPLIPKKLYFGYGQIFLARSQTNYTRNLQNDIVINDDLSFHTYSMVGIAAGPFTGFSFGASVKLLAEGNDGDSNTDLLFDVGFQYSFSAIPLRLGLSMQNIYFHAHSHYEDDYLPYIVRMGAFYTLFDLGKHKLDLFVNTAKGEERDWDFSLAGEYTLMHNFLFRVGYQTGDSLPRIGIGYKNVTIDLSIFVDISYRYTSASDSTLKFTFGVDF